MPTPITQIRPNSYRGRAELTISYVDLEAEELLGTRDLAATIMDNGQGHIVTYGAGNLIDLGVIDYSTGVLTIGTNFSHPNAYDEYGPNVHKLDRVYTWNEYVTKRKNETNNPGIVVRRIRVVSFADGAEVIPEQPPTEPRVPPTAIPEGGLIASVIVNNVFAKAFVAPGYALKNVGFSIGGYIYQQLTDGTIVRSISPTTGVGIPCGSVDSTAGTVSISNWSVDAPPLINSWRGVISPPSVGVEAPFTAFRSTFRTASSPLRPASVSVLGRMQDGTTFNVSADSSGLINGTRVKGRVDYQYGLIELYFVNPDGDTDLNVDLSFLTIPGLTTIPADLVMIESVRYNAVAYSYLPLDATLLGIDPVRLPSDGRVPIFRTGGFAVVGNTGKITATVINGQVINCARVRLSRVRVVGFDKVVINTGYTADLETGLVTFTDVSGYSQPVTVEHRIEDMAVVRDVQINGDLTFTRALTHNYPIGSYVSSALVSGDLKSRVPVLFDQATWNGTTWLDAVSGAAATGTYNDVLAPLVVTNKGAVTERWALVFTSTTAFNIVGEHVGVIGTGSINADLAPNNVAASAPYFTLPALGWGLGWSVGNILRFNTVGAMTPIWLVRTVQQGPSAGVEHSFTLLSRGDVDRT